MKKQSDTVEEDIPFEILDIFLFLNNLKNIVIHLIWKL